MKSFEMAAYTRGRPNRLGKILNGANYWWARMGIPPTFHQIAIEAPGRRSGAMRRAVVLVADYERERYLVSMLGGRSDWLLNAQANNGRAAIRKRRRRIPIRLTEVPVEERAPIIKAWAARAIGGRHHLPVEHSAPLSEFEAIADRVPVVRIEEVAGPTA